jgi:hypothetical protein
MRSFGSFLQPLAAYEQKFKARPSRSRTSEVVKAGYLVITPATGA